MYEKHATLVELEEITLKLMDNNISYFVRMYPMMYDGIPKVEIRCLLYDEEDIELLHAMGFKKQ